VSDPASTPLLPPRPNLGPEPLADPGLFSPLVLTLILAGLVLVAVLTRHRRLRKRRSSTPNHNGGESTTGEDSSARNRLIALSPTIRSALTRRFGPSCLAKTTEELASDDRIGEILGRADFEQLIGILNAIDRLKFSVPTLSDDDVSSMAADLEVWTPSVVQLTKTLEAGRNGG
jgi:hypothetical protein